MVLAVDLLRAPDQLRDRQVVDRANLGQREFVCHWFLHPRRNWDTL
jgi:hypothetical protein